MEVWVPCQGMDIQIESVWRYDLALGVFKDQRSVRSPVVGKHLGNVASGRKAPASRMGRGDGDLQRLAVCLALPGEKGPVTQRLPYHTEELKRNLRNFTALIELVICCFIKSKEPVSTSTWKLLQPPPLLIAQIYNICTNCH